MMRGEIARWSKSTPLKQPSEPFQIYREDGATSKCPPTYPLPVKVPLEPLRPMASVMPADVGLIRVIGSDVE